MSMQFKNPPSTASTVGSQIVNQYYAKKALVELPKLTFFTQLADVTSMPKNYGKKIKRYHYMPLLDDRNINDQGLDAAGASYTGGNLYGSSKDIGTIPGKMPALSETGGRVNRVGFKRIELEGTLEKFGFFDEYTQESMDFDTDEQLLEHINREMILGANEIIEDSLQIDLIASAGVVRYAGTATGNSSIDENCVVSYGDLMRTSIQLDQNRCPKQTKIITGSRMIDTKTIPSARVAYIGSELLPIFKAMKDLHNNPAFVGVERYGDAVGTTLNGEIGTVDQFRLVVHPEMMKWAGAGATADDASFHATAGKYDVFPILVVGDESFTTIGFQTDGKTVKFKIMHKAPGEATANQLDPYGETGFMSIKWYYGFMCLRPERIALIKTAAKM
jgi:N4-gp56 family major capsid protein